MKNRNLLKFGIMTAALSVGFAGAAQAQYQNQDSPRMQVNGQPFRPANEPIVQDGRVLVPLRGIFERLGANVDYNRRDRSIVARRDRTTVRMALDSPHANVNARHVMLDVPATAYNGVTYVPLRFVSEALGANVNYNSNRRLVSINDNDRDGGWREGRGNGRGPGRNDGPGRGRGDNDGRDRDGRGYDGRVLRDQ
jgi:hypothetical protein